MDNTQTAGGSVLNLKQCGNCAHSMESDDEGQVFCISNPPTPVALGGSVQIIFPMLFKWAKCDHFAEGTTQPKGQP